MPICGRTSSPGTSPPIMCGPLKATWTQGRHGQLENQSEFSYFLDPVVSTEHGPLWNSIAQSTYEARDGQSLGSRASRSDLRVELTVSARVTGGPSIPAW